MGGFLPELVGYPGRAVRGALVGRFFAYRAYLLMEGRLPVADPLAV